MGGITKKNEKSKPNSMPALIGVLMLLAGIGLLALFVIDIIYAGNLMKFFQNTHFYHGLLVALDRIALTALGVVLVVAGVRWLLRKKLSGALYCLMPVLLGVVIMIRSLFRLGQYQRRDCLPSTDADGLLEFCPYVDNELLGLFIFNLLIYTVGAVAAVVIYRRVKSKNSKK
jgi:hypothetical protein